jgi:hypothetical protein
MTQKTEEILKKRLIKFAHIIIGHKLNDISYIYNDKNLDNVFSDYKNIKNTIKELLENKDFLVDRHKISACFISAILNNSPIKIKTSSYNKKEILELEFIINMNLAILFSDYIIKSFYKKLYNKELKMAKPQSSTNKPYIDQLVGLIRIIDIANKEILLLAISHILFLLEKYSEVVENKQ